MTGVIQHPYGESDQAWGAMPTSSGAAAYMGYFGPIPVSTPAATSAAAPRAAAITLFAAALLALLL